MGLTLLAGCGMPGEPLPPLLEIPEPVRDLSAAQVGAGIELTWSVPRLTTEGTRVRRLDRLELYAAFAAPDTAADDFAGRAELVEALASDKLLSQQEPVSYHLPLSRDRVGFRARFAVKAINDRGRDAGFSNIVAVAIVDLPDSPSNLQATLTEKAIRLRWVPAGRSVFGGAAPAVTGYQILRQILRQNLPETGGSSQPAAVIAMTESTEYDDAAFQFGPTYVYSVRAFRQAGESVAATPASSRVQVEAVDRFPPAPPQNFRAIAIPGAVEMSWSPNTESDLAGYNVYRSQGGPFQKLNPQPLPVPLFRDASVATGAPYSYQLRATDHQGNESGPSEEVSLTAE
ncbi:MAG: hypothetical protein HY649_03000 [Acidobacteria bacterium]|nr:hypothetical protein [Acidobacteriota bacterium]